MRLFFIILYFLQFSTILVDLCLFLGDILFGNMPNLRYNEQCVLGGKMTASKKAGVLYNLAKQAKRRMKNYNNGGIQHLSYAKLAYSDKDQDLYKKICKMLDEDRIIINPINELMDKKYYDTLSFEGKQRYILDLSEKYRQMKERYDRERTLSKVSSY